MTLTRSAFICFLIGFGWMLWIGLNASAFSILELRSEESPPQFVADVGFSQGVIIGTLLEIYRIEPLTSEDPKAHRSREVFVAKALVIDAREDWCLAEPVGVPIEPLAAGQQVRVKQHNTVRYVTGSDRNALLDLNAATSQKLRPGDKLQVLRPMRAIHPVTQETVEWFDPIATIQIDHVTPHLFTARGYVIAAAKPVLGGDRVIQPQPNPSGIHVLRVLDDGLYLNRFPGALPGIDGDLRRLSQPDRSVLRFHVRRVYEHLVEIACAEPGTFVVGEPVQLEFQNEAENDLSDEPSAPPNPQPPVPEVSSDPAAEEMGTGPIATEEDSE